MPFLKAIRDVVVHAGERCNSSFYAPEQNPPRSPMHQIPVELLGEIFSHYPDSHRKDSDNRSSCLSTSLHNTADPFSLGHVCRHWRFVALSTPMLWASLAVYRPKPYMVPMVRAWLERAADCPLSLFMLVNFKPTALEAVTANTLLSLFVTRFHQWKHIELHLTGIYAPLLNLPLGGAPRLQSASLRLCEWDFTSADKVWCAISPSSELRRMLWDPWYMERNVATHIPWTQLTHVKMNMGCHCSLSADAFLAILRSCQELMELDFDAQIPCTTELNTPPFVLPKLRTLKLRGVDCSPTPYINCLTLPSLTSIDICQRSPGIFYLEDLLRRSSCQLEELRLVDLGLEERDIITFLSSPHLQSLHDLSVWAATVCMTIEVLTHGVLNRGPILPDLRGLFLCTCDTPDGALSDMVTARLPVLEAFKGGAKRGNAHPKDLLFMESLRNAGLDFQLNVYIS